MYIVVKQPAGCFVGEGFLTGGLDKDCHLNLLWYRTLEWFLHNKVKQ